MPETGIVARRILLVDDDDAVRDMMNHTLTGKGYVVVTAARVSEALKYIANESFDVLITDLHMPNPGDGFTVVSAMRHSQPQARTLLISGYPDVHGAMAAILLEADEVLVKPFEVTQLLELIDKAMPIRENIKRINKESVATILARCTGAIVSTWLKDSKESLELNSLLLTDSERTGYLDKLVQDLVARLRGGSSQKGHHNLVSQSAITHGKLRHEQGYSPEMLVHESRLLQVSIFGTLKNNMNSLDFSLLLADVMVIADEVDAQLTQTMGSFMRFKNTAVA
jgi:DNA-binding response OmpR family regulator